MKFYKKAIILAVIAVLVGTAFWYFQVKGKREKKEAEEKAALLFKETDKKISSITLTKKGEKPIVVKRIPAEAESAENKTGGEKAVKEEGAQPAGQGSEEQKSAEKKADEQKTAEGTEEKKEDRWIITSPVETQGDALSVEAFTENLKKAKRDSVIYESVEKLDEYGLNDPEYSIRFSYEGETDKHGIDFGSQSLDGKKVFARVVGQDKIIAVEAGVRDRLQKKLIDLRDKTIAHFKSEDLTALSVLSSIQFVMLQKIDGTWYLMPKKIKASDARVDILKGDLQWGSFVEVEEEKADPRSLQKYGLDKPRVVVSMKFQDGSVYLLAVGNSIKQGKAQFYYATRSTDSMIFQLQAETVNRLLMTNFDLKDRSIFNFKPEDVTAVTLKWEDKSYSFSRDGDNWKFSDSGKTLDRGYKIDNIVRGIASAEYEQKEPIKKGDPGYRETGMDNPKYRVELEFSNGREPVTVVLTEKDEKTGKLYLSPNNGETAYFTSGYFVSYFPESRDDLMD